MNKKTALSIAGSDCSGGAGIQADLKTMTMNGVYAMSVITALTAQNTTGVRDIMEVTPAFLAEQMDDEISCTVALLHDVVEDTPVTIKDLEKEFPQAVTEAVALLTYDGTGDYFDYVRNLKDNYYARRVKTADLVHNSDETRVAHREITEEKLQELRRKYKKAKAILLDEE